MPPPRTLAQELLAEERERQEAPQESARESTGVVDIATSDRTARTLDRLFTRGGGVHVPEQKPAKKAKGPVDVRDLSPEQREALEFELFKAKRDEEERNRGPVEPASEEEAAALVDELGLDDPYAYTPPFDPYGGGWAA